MKIRADNITVQWWDGFKRGYECIEYEPGSDYLWINLKAGFSIWIPTRHVRWFSAQEQDDKHD